MRNTTALARTIHRDGGVGFWDRKDAEKHAALERLRTGNNIEVVAVGSQFGTHRMWFVKAVA